MISIDELKAGINKVVGEGNFSPMTDFFRFGDSVSQKVLFVAIRDTSTQNFYVFYTDLGQLQHKLIGGAAEFSRFINTCYDLNDFDVNDSAGFYKRVNKEDHRRAYNVGYSLLYNDPMYAQPYQDQSEAKYA